MSGRSMNWGDARQAFSESRGSGGNSGFRFVISDKESVPVRFLIPESGDEPYIYKRHYVKNKGYHVCAEDLAEDNKHAGCVICVEAKNQGKKGPVGLSNRAFAFSVYDPRKTHVFKEKVAGKDGKESKYHPCADDPTCRWCKKGDVPKVNGLRHWTLSGKVAQQLETWERQVLGKNCAACDRGTIKVTSYVCPKCEAEMEIDDPNEESRCFECSNASKKKGGPKVVMVHPQEVVVCSRGCDDARRKSLADSWIMVTRSGADQDTSYNFTVTEEPMEVPSDVKSIDFKTNPDFKPAPANEQAAMLQVQNPFRGGRRPAAAEDPDDDDNDGAPGPGYDAAAPDGDDDEDDSIFK